MTMLVALIAAIALTSPFGTAEGTAIDDSDGLVITVSVEVVGTYEVVLVRPFSSFEELPPTALIAREDGAWGGTVRLPSAENWSLVFDAIEPDGASDRSDSVTLIDLGIDPVVVDGAPTAPVDAGPASAGWWRVARAWARPAGRMWQTQAGRMWVARVGRPWASNNSRIPRGPLHIPADSRMRERPVRSRGNNRCGRGSRRHPSRKARG